MARLVYPQDAGDGPNPTNDRARGAKLPQGRVNRSPFEAIGRWLALAASVGGGALAEQPTGELRELVKVEVTGSNIPRPDGESALPVQIVTREDIRRSGAVTTPELIGRLSANLLGVNDQLGIGGTVRPGLASANLRGIGDGSTLVLLNGRRVANYAFDGSQVDLNAIPLSAIDRIEILKDGASAVYGSDAIAGVINFILRKDFHGFEATAYRAWTEHGGADASQAILSAGYGDLSADRFNVFATLSHQKTEALRSIERPFSRTGYLPSEGVDQLSAATFPANIQVTPRLIVNPSYATGCAPPASLPDYLPFFSDGPICAYDFTSTIDIVPPAERTGAVARGTLQIDANTQWFAEGDYSHNRFVLRNSPTSVLFSVLSSTVPVLYPAGGPYFPTQFAAANGISGDLPLQLRYRTAALGAETNATDTRALRMVAGVEGVASSWSYGSALTYSENQQTQRFVSGYVSQQRLIAALYSGLINPFGPSTPEGDALLASTQITGKAHEGKGIVIDFDTKASKDVYEIAGGWVAVAAGAELRRERLENVYEPVWTSGDVLGVRGDHQSVSGTRNAWAVFAEASIPFVKSVTGQIALRHDHYGDFGGTTNPKIALRWRPERALVVRASWGTGFRAPALYDLFTPIFHTGIAGAKLQDPIRCPITHLPEDCPGDFGGVFRVALGGDPNLKPETSEQFNAGIVWEVASGRLLSVDYWKIHKSGVIGSLNETVVFGNFDRYALSNIIRKPVEADFPNLPGPIDTVILTEQNLGGLRTSGVDLGVNWRGPALPIGRLDLRLDGTYVRVWEQQLDAITYTSALGRKGFGIAGPVPRWRHSAMLNWHHDRWDATLAQTYQSGYFDANVTRTGALLPVPPRRVGSYDIWDLQGRYSGFRGVAIALGVKNFMDRAPPFSNQPFTRQFGYDPAYADPRGRTFYVRLTFALG